ncbi:hypothetical protein [Acinetobacter baumannii]|uniref:hypothetical protein n=1 Tax=Acinetobacter baumannii TaxID=470 RepID=UPI0010579AA1|nr:hypothetical protein [Acinetobacter baumannii]MCY3197901.1 hypothetical protein [Acinetobacter baumannii]MCZ3010234.1 hypothetical protein [Acinetobacter baumannii]MDC4436960.1 hypothetical protein [Acinetobacter baumannii]MDC4478229.1 hypothetical protein [Acinetobacter baumannii]MDC4643722.1 hypothetical protein [Acinetobacter baumannii]
MASAVDIVKDMIKNFPYDKSWTPSQFINFYWNIYAKNYPSNKSINGSIFEQLIVISLIRENISPIYVQAKLAFVPNVILDIVLYNRKNPVTISAKTTLRERWKQADLEAMATKYVHRDAKCFVVTLSESEVLMRRKEENSYMGIDRFVLAHTSEFDQFIDELKQINFKESESIEIIQTSHKFYNLDKIEEQYGFKVV